MQNDPSLHQDQQSQADHLIKAKGAEEAAAFKNEDDANKKDGSEKRDGSRLNEAEKEKQTDPKDFEPFDLDDSKLAQLNEGDDHHE